MLRVKSLICDGGRCDFCKKSQFPLVYMKKIVKKKKALSEAKPPQRPPLGTW